MSTTRSCLAAALFALAASTGKAVQVSGMDVLRVKDGQFPRICTQLQAH